MSRNKSVKLAKPKKITTAIVDDSGGQKTSDDVRSLLLNYANIKLKMDSFKDPADKANAELKAHMSSTKTKKTADYVESIDGCLFSISASLSETEGTTIDIEKFKTLVTPEVFEKCITISAADVEKYAGTVVADACKKPTGKITQTLRLSTKPIKK